MQTKKEMIEAVSAPYLTICAQVENQYNKIYDALDPKSSLTKKERMKILGPGLVGWTFLLSLYVASGGR